jgi:arylsulfatase A-like enzyme
MKTRINTSLICLFIGIASGLLSCTRKDSNPNFILLMADDLGWGDTGFNGNDTVKTPHLDLMASQGLIFSRFYSASPVCSPTRASCLTGRNPYRMGIPNANSGHLPTSETTIAEILKEQGYATGHFGKWHLGTFTNELKDANRAQPGDDTHLSVPTDHGFDVFFSTESKVPTWDPMYKPKTFNKEIGESLRYGWLAREDKETDNYGTRYWTGKNQESKIELNGDDSKLIFNEAIRYISESVASNKPFLAVIWTHAPHLPVVVNGQSIEDYRDLEFQKQLYYGSISNLDEQVGRLSYTLKELNISGRTCIFFCSDNGPEVQTPGSAGQFRGRKRDLYEGGIRVPAFCTWPDQIRGGEITDFPSFTSDYFPTILDILNIKSRSTDQLDGMSILPVLSGEDIDREKAMGFLYPNKQSWVTQKYKLISVDKGKSFELYDLITDHQENYNLFNQKPELGAEMKQSLTIWLESVYADLNKINENE